MFYLKMHPTHFILHLYGIRNMVKNHLDRKKGNPLPPLHGLFFSDYEQGLFYMYHPTDRIAQGFWYISHGALAAMKNS